MNTQEKQNNVATLLGGLPLKVTYQDGSSEELTIKQLPVKQMLPLLKAIDDEPAMAELFCGKPEGWSASLTPESFELVVEEGDKLNRDFFVRWVQRRQRRMKSLVPGITEKLTTAAVSLSPTTSQK